MIEDIDIDPMQLNNYDMDGSKQASYTIKTAWYHHAECRVEETARYHHAEC